MSKIARVGIVRNVEREAEAVRQLVDHLATIGVETDEQLKLDMIEGETTFNDCIGAAIDRIDELESMIEAIKDREQALAHRRHRFASQIELLRAAVQAALETADVAKLEMAQRTVSLKKVPPSVIVQNEADIPVHYWKRSDPKLDKAKLLADLKAQMAVPGCTLSNGGMTIAIR